MGLGLAVCVTGLLGMALGQCSRTATRGMEGGCVIHPLCLTFLLHPHLPQDLWTASCAIDRELRHLIVFLCIIMPALGNTCLCLPPSLEGPFFQPLTVLFLSQPGVWLLVGQTSLWVSFTVPPPHVPDLAVPVRFSFCAAADRT